MVEDLVTGGILPTNDASSDDAEFDPNAIESDDLLDDFVGDDLLGDDLPLGISEEDDAFSENE